MAEMKLNRKLVEKMIAGLESKPESYYQGKYLYWVRSADDASWLAVSSESRPAPPCGSVHCLAGKAIIYSAPSVKQGIEKLDRLIRKYNRVGNLRPLADEAATLINIPNQTNYDLFGGNASGWPEPYKQQWFSAATYRGQARAAINLLRAILRTDGKILEG